MAGLTVAVATYRVPNGLTRTTKRITSRYLTANIFSPMKSGQNSVTYATSATAETSPTTTIDDSAIKPFSAMPGPRGLYNIPYLGFLFHLKPFGKYDIGNIHFIFRELRDRYGPVFRLQTNAPSVVVSDLDDMATVWKSQGKFPRRPNMDIYDVYTRRTGRRPNLGIAQGEDWWYLREPMQRIMLKDKNMLKYLHSMDGVVEEFINMVSNGYLNNHDVESTLNAYMAEAVGTAFFNRRLGFLDAEPTPESEKFLKASTEIFDLAFQSLVGSSISYKFYRSKGYVMFEDAQKYIRVVISAFVKEAKAEMRKLEAMGEEIDDSHILFSLLKEPGMTEEDVILITEALYAGAIDSSASTFQVIMYALAKNQDKQEKLRQEILDVTTRNLQQENEGGGGGNETASSGSSIKDLVNNLPYLKACVKEVHRLFRVLPFATVRILPTDVVLGGYHVPAGVQIYNYSIKACGDEDVFEKPEQYLPERWMRTPGEGIYSSAVDSERNRKWAVLPFGMGSRSCPGRRLFEYETYLTLIRLLSKQRIGLEPGYEQTPFIYRMSLKPKTPLKFTFTPVEGGK